MGNDEERLPPFHLSGSFAVIVSAFIQRHIVLGECMMDSDYNDCLSTAAEELPKLMDL
jgi:hypothetical protein